MAVHILLQYLGAWHIFAPLLWRFPLYWSLTPTTVLIVYRVRKTQREWRRPCARYDQWGSSWSDYTFVCLIDHKENSNGVTICPVWLDIFIYISYILVIVFSRTLCLWVVTSLALTLVIDWSYYLIPGWTDYNRQGWY